ncbi:MAG TPA: hypothetical protein VK524_35265 [Polyangiaceae bacterium]|nr:hypothetical protein [Polyangiaceae bacterium]
MGGCSMVMGEVPDKQRPRLVDEDGGTRDSSLQDGGLDADAGDALPDVNADACDGAPERVFFEDRDDDGFGKSSTAVIACEPPAAKGWAQSGGDCLDSNQYVRPGQILFFGTGYRTESGALSFDFDCDGVEIAGPNQAHAPEDCRGLLVCLGGGFTRNETRELGPGVNMYCGSNLISSCVPGLECMPQVVTSDRYYLCR